MSIYLIFAIINNSISRYFIYALIIGILSVIWYLKSRKKIKELKYIKKIIEFLQNKKLPKDIRDLNEIKGLDILDKYYYKKLSEILINCKSKDYGFKEKEKQYIFDNIIEIMFIIYKSRPELFLISDFLRSLVYLIIIMPVSEIQINNEFVLDLFYCLLSILEDINSNSKINKEIKLFEKDMFIIIENCLNKYIAEFDINIKPYQKPKNLHNIIKCLGEIRKYNNLKFPFPLYLEGLISYFKKAPIEKYIIIKIYKYFELHKFSSTNNNYDYYEIGYILYSIISYDNKKIIFQIKEFNKLKSKRLKNEYAKKILKLSIELLKAKDVFEYKNIFLENNIQINNCKPKVSKKFDDDKEYYKDLYNQLIFSISECIKKSYNCNIPLQNEIKKSLWLSYLEILFICLSEEEISDNKIKIIFYFIANIFSFHMNIKSLEFCNDTIPLLYLDSIKYNYIFVFPELYKLFDSEYSQYYSHLNDNSNFEKGLSDYLYDTISQNYKYQNFIKENSDVNGEINNLKKINSNLPIPILYNYLETIELNLKKISFLNPGIKILYKNAFNYIRDEKIKKNLFENYPNIIDEANYFNKMHSILSEQDYIDLIKNIMKSNVMRESYALINKWYLSNGDFDLKQKKDKNKCISTNEEKKLINGKEIINYYNDFCNILKEFDYSKIFIIMNLPKVIKGFTFRFLKIILNCYGIEINLSNPNHNWDELLKAYLIFVIIHEQNHFIKRYFNEEIDYNLYRTPKLNDINGGGEQLIDLLFDERLINSYINVEQAQYILNIDNWNNKPVKQFRNDFNKIKKNENESSIIYLSSYSRSICDSSKLLV